MIKVGDEVTVKNSGWLPTSHVGRKEGRKFTVMEFNTGGGVVIDVTELNSGWPRTRLGEGTYWNIGIRHLTVIPRTILIGGELL